MGKRRRSFSAVEGGKHDDLDMKSDKNRERAYTAASRRSDRSLEARYQSALMASDVHKRRTGKALRITHEIVAKEEMYEEEDHILPEPRHWSLERIERTAMSRTNAYIASLIARRAGVPNLSQLNQSLDIPQFVKSMPWRPLTAYDLTNNGDSTQPLHHEPEVSLPKDILHHSNDLNAFNMLRASEDQSTVTELCFIDAALCDDTTYLEHKSSVASFISDSPIYDSQFTFETSPESGSSSTSASSLYLEDSLVDFNSESVPSFI